MNKVIIKNHQYFTEILDDEMIRERLVESLKTTSPYENIICASYSDEGFGIFDIIDILDDGTIVVDFTGTAC